MHDYMNTKKFKTIAGFTLVELIVVISIVGILAGIVAVGYSGWQKSSVTSQLKSDLNGVASAMENARTFNNAYPIHAIPSTFKPSSNVALVAIDNSSNSGKTYCIDATSTRDATIKYYVDSSSGNLGAQLGTCATRTGVPGTTPIPTNLTATAVAKDTINLAWTVVTGANYTVQRSSNSAFTDASTIATPIAGTTTLVSSGLTPGTEYYYRISSTLSGATSGWSLVASATTTSSCADNNQYGTPPNCYAYDALPVAASIEGYWTTAPDGYLFEDGSAVSRIKYADLFASIGTTFGAGNGITTFNIPDSRGRTTVNQNTSDVEFATIGQKTGSKTEAIAVAQMPSHNHTGTTGPGNSMWYRCLNWSGSGVEANHMLGWDGSGGYADYNNANWPLAGHTHPFTSDSTGSGFGHNNIQPSIVKNSAVKYRQATGSASTLPAASSISGYWNIAPSGYLYEDGSAVSRASYPNLFTAISTTYGVGDGSTTFNLPNSKGLATVNISTIDTEYNVMYEKTGSKTETLTIAQMPSHNHTGATGPGNPLWYRLVYSPGTSSADNHVAGWNSDGGWTDYADASYSMRDHTHSFTTNTTGGDGSHNNIQPSITKMTVIKTGDASGSFTTSTGTSINGYWPMAPAGYFLEDGSAKSRTVNAALFAVIGTTYGVGDGSTTFNLPDSRGRLSVNRNAVDPEFDSMGEKYGTKIVTLETSQLPSHNHTGTTGGGNAMPYRVVNYSGGGRAGNHTSGYSSAAYTDHSDSSYPNRDHTHSFTTNAVGGGGSHNELQPTVAKMYAIKY